MINDRFLKYRSDDGFLKRNGTNGVIPGVKRDNWVIKTTKGIVDLLFFSSLTITLMNFSYRMLRKKLRSIKCRITQ